MTLLIDINTRDLPIDHEKIEQLLLDQSDSDTAFVQFVMKQYLKGLDAFAHNPSFVNRFTMRAGADRSTLHVAHQVTVRDTQVDVYRAYVHYSQDLSIQLRRTLNSANQAFCGVWAGIQADSKFVDTDVAIFATLSLSDLFHGFSDPIYRYDFHTDDTLLVSCGLPMNPLSCSISIPSRMKVLETLEALGKSL
jgi:hypothetical protein